MENKLRRLASYVPGIVFERGVPMNRVVEAASNADICVLPYLPTNLNHVYCSPSKLFEYIQAGLALATSSLPFLREVVLGNGPGVVFDPDDPRDIAARIDFASQESNLANLKRNVQKVRYRYSWDYEKNQLYRAYADLAT